MSEKVMTQDEKETLKKEAEEARKTAEVKNTEKQKAFGGLRQLQGVVKEALLNEKDRNGPQFTKKSNRNFAQPAERCEYGIGYLSHRIN